MRQPGEKPEGTQLNPETLDFIYQHTRDAPEAQMRDVEALDAKMVQVFSAASVVVGLAGLAVSRVEGNTVAASLLMAALAAYMVTTAFALLHLRVRRVRRSFQADALWPDWWDRQPVALKHGLVKDISEAYAFNNGLMRQKRRTLQGALVALGTEVAAIGVFLIYSLWA